MTAPIKHGRAVGRFGDYLCVDCANLPYVGGHNQFKNSNFARPNTKIPKSSPDGRTDTSMMRHILHLTELSVCNEEVSEFGTFLYIWLCCFC